MRPQLTTKPDIDRACDMWDHFWAGEVLKRPLVMASVGKNGFNQWELKEDKTDEPYWNAVNGKYDRQIDHYNNIVENTMYLGEMIPSFSGNLGPDQMASIIGGSPLHFAEGSMYTNWVDPVVEDWDTFEFTLPDESPTWQGMRTYNKMLAEAGKGKYIVQIPDIHSNADALSALRGPQTFCMDFYDNPEGVDRAMKEVRKLFPLMYDTLYEEAGMAETGTSCWIPFWCEGKYATIQCDYICMVSPEMGLKYIIPALEEEAQFLDHCIYHLDGPGTIPHLDNILAIKEIDAIQWVSGGGQPAMHTWTDLLVRCQEAGKKLVIYGGGGVDFVKEVMSRLSPEGVVFQIGVESEKEFDEICKWLEQNT